MNLEEADVNIRGKFRPNDVVFDLQGHILRSTVAGPLRMNPSFADQVSWGVEEVVINDVATYVPALETHGLELQKCLGPKYRARRWE